MSWNLEMLSVDLGAEALGKGREGKSTAEEMRGIRAGGGRCAV